MAMTIVGSARPVVGGVDTHLDVHVAAVVDAAGGLLGVESFPCGDPLAMTGLARACPDACTQAVPRTTCRPVTATGRMA